MDKLGKRRPVPSSQKPKLLLDNQVQLVLHAPSVDVPHSQCVTNIGVDQLGGLRLVRPRGGVAMRHEHKSFQVNDCKLTQINMFIDSLIHQLTESCHAASDAAAMQPVGPWSVVTT